MVFLKWLSRLVFSCCVIAAAWGAWYVIYQGSLASVVTKEKPKSSKPISVEVVSAREEAIDERLVLVGNFLPSTQTEVRSFVDGYIRAIYFDVGDYVTVNDLLCRLDDTTHQDRLSQAQAALDVAMAQLAVQGAELRSAQVALDREVMLDELGVGTQQGLETATSLKEIAEARLKLEESRVAEARANYTTLKSELKNFELVAPISGYVSARLADIGDLAKPDASIMQIVDLKTVRTTVNIVEKDYHKVAVGQKANVSVDAYPTQVFTGLVSRIAPTLNQETRTAAVQIEVQNPEYLLKPGMYARVSLNSDQTSQGVVVPLAAILEVNNLAFTYIVDETNKTEMRQVRLGTTNGSFVEIVEGVKPGERVITLGNRDVQPGQDVIAQEVSWSSVNSLTENSLIPSAEILESAPLAAE